MSEMTDEQVSYRVRPDLSAVVLTDHNSGMRWQVGDEFDIRWTLGIEEGLTRVRVARVLSDGARSQIELERAGPLESEIIHG